MMQFLRWLRDWSSAGGNRTVAGRQETLDPREASYIRDSNARLDALFRLYRKFRGTAQEAQMKSVYEKTKKIHDYLIARKRIQELELFHIQYTQHFISTFTLILEAYQTRQPVPRAAPAAVAAARAYAGQELPAKPGKQLPPESKSLNGLAGSSPPEGTRTQIPRLAVAEIRLNPQARIAYQAETSGSRPAFREIGPHSPEADKQAFLAYLSESLGIGKASYLGNALVNIPDSQDLPPTGLVPVIRWQGNTYALHLDQRRLFPVCILLA